MRDRTTRALFFILGAASLALGACGADLSDGAQTVGQRCWSEADCAAGLLCSVDRVCAPLSLTPGADAGPLPDGGPRPDGGPFPDASSCEGLPICSGPEGVRVCEGGAAVERACPNGMLCSGGQCLPTGECIDADQDGFSANCEPRDCNDADPGIAPGAPEACDMIDNNCDGQVDEGACGGCCPGDCVTGAPRFCSDCACVLYDPLVCTESYQPCAREGSSSNGFTCLTIDEDQGPQCFGVCNTRAPDPSRSCPEPDQDCVDGGSSMGSGICLDRCAPGSSCDSTRLACVSYTDSSSGGVCLPSDPFAPGLGQGCMPERGFSACSEGALCVPLGPDPVCRLSCRPFLFGAASDCDPGASCLAIDDNIGVCVLDGAGSEGRRCATPLQACGEDGVVCVPLGPGGGTCVRQCRPANRNADCSGGRRCRSVPGGALSDELGVCVRF